MVAVKAGDTAVLEIETGFVTTGHLSADSLVSTDEPSPTMIWCGGLGV